jgi:hypothetical protein
MQGLNLASVETSNSLFAVAAAIGPRCFGTAPCARRGVEPVVIRGATAEVRA